MRDCLIRLLLLLALAGPAGAGPVGPFFAVTEENDSLSNPFGSHQDRHYTQGLKFIYLGGQNRLAPPARWLAEHLPATGLHEPVFQAGLTLGQNFYTPKDLYDTQYIKTDRPYAGWLYVGGIFLRRGVTPHEQIPVLDSFEVDLGTTGHPSLADNIQRFYHRAITGDDPPRGWGNQVDAQPGLQLRGARLWRLSPGQTANGNDRHFDLIPLAGANLGNIQTCGALSLTARLGWHLPDDFGVQGIDSTAALHGGYQPDGPRSGFHLIGRVEGRAVAWNTFLDGNNWHEGPKIRSRPVVGDFTWGFEWQLNRHLAISYLRTIRTQEYYGQETNDIFGMLSIKTGFRF